MAAFATVLALLALLGALRWNVPLSSRDAVLLEVRQYYLSMREAEKRIEASQAGVNQAEEYLRIAELRYGAGVGTNLDVLDAVLSLNTAKLSNIQALYDYNTNKAQLNRAMGTPVK